LMLALAIEFSRCSEARTPRAEQCAGPARPPHPPSPAPWGQIRRGPSSPTE